MRGERDSDNEILELEESYSIEIEVKKKKGNFFFLRMR